MAIDRYFGKILEIPNTLALLIQAWQAAEKSLQHDIQAYHPDSDEEFITQMFHGKYAAILSYASQLKHIENAFLKDLRNAFPNLDGPLEKIATSLIAEVTVHKRTTEKLTGGDIGFLIIRPQVSDQGDYLKISDYRRGLLCQAKLKNLEGKWGTFTKRQLQVLPERLPYLGLLLYNYTDGARRSLNHFHWQLCNMTTFDEVRRWLKHDDFPALVTSDKVITSLTLGAIGTDDNDILDSVITPARNPTLIIRVTWPDDQRPSSTVMVYSRQENQAKQKISMRQL